MSFCFGSSLGPLHGVYLATGAVAELYVALLPQHKELTLTSEMSSKYQWEGFPHLHMSNLPPAVSLRLAGNHFASLSENAVKRILSWFPAVFVQVGIFSSACSTGNYLRFLLEFSFVLPSVYIVLL